MFTINEKTLDANNFLISNHFSEPSLDEIAGEWNQNVLMRAQELETNIDSTYTDIIVPNILGTLRELASSKSKIVDVGCGLGHLTNIVAKNGYDVSGIDIAERAIDYAKVTFPNIEFECASIVDFAKRNTGTFDICIANMVLHNIVDLNITLYALNYLLRNGGYVIASIPDPRFWFNKHVKNLPFKYDTFQVYKIRFKVRHGIVHPSLVTYIHRPIVQYNEFINNSGFEIRHSDHPRLRNGQQDNDLLFCIWQKPLAYT